jgi:hypothetical protein
VTYDQLEENKLDQQNRFTFKVSLFNPNQGKYPFKRYDISETLSGPSKNGVRQKLAQLILDKPTQDQLTIIRTKKKSSATIKAKFLRTFYFILSTESSLSNRLPLIWNSGGFKHIIQELGLRIQVEDLFLKWYNSKTFVSHHWVRFDNENK